MVSVMVMLIIDHLVERSKTPIEITFGYEPTLSMRFGTIMEHYPEDGNLVVNEEEMLLLGDG